MLKKAAPALLATAAILAGCNGDDEALPPNNETPMEDVQDGNGEMFDNDNNNDLLDDMDGNEGDNGNNGNNGNRTVDPDGTGPGFGEFGGDEGGGTDVQERDEIMEDDLDRNNNAGQ